MVAATIGATIGAQRWQVRQQIRQCAADGRSIRETWTAQAREDLRAALLASDARHAAIGAERVEQTIDRFADEWADAEGRVCLRRRVTAAWDASTAERAQECLLAARWSLAGLLAVLQEKDPRSAQRAVQAAAGLPAVAPVSLHNLSTLAYERRAVDEARHLHERAIAIRERALGPNHLDVSGSLNNLAVMLQAQGDHTAAQRLYERSWRSPRRRCRRSTRTWPARRSTSATCTPRAACTRRRCGCSPAGWRSRRSCTDPTTRSWAAALYGMGNVHSARGAWPEARRLFVRVLDLQEREHGPDHLRVADALNNIADVDVELAESGAADRDEVLDEAERMQRRVLSMYGRILAPEDPEYGFPLSGLGFIELARKRPREAIVWFERAMQATRSAAASFDAASACRYGVAQVVWAADHDASRAR